jgi:exopolysaccharide production protein ExoZ
VSGSANSTNSRVLVSIQYLRGIAAMMVVYHHAHDRLAGVYTALPNPLGEAGVDLFFVISGFIMVLTTSGSSAGPRTFLLRRVARIVPTYWIYTSALALFVALLPSALNQKVTLPHYLKSLLFVPHIAPLDQSIEPVLPPGWTLNYEMFFYCLFAASLLASAAYRVPILVLALVGLVACGSVFTAHGPLLIAYTSPLLLEFAFGALIGSLYVTGRLAGLDRKAGWSMICGGTAIGVFSATFVLPRPLVDFDTSPLRVATYGIASVLIVVGALTLERTGTNARRRGPPLVTLGLIGDASYALYLTHLFSIVGLRIGWLALGLGTEGLPWAIAFVAAGTVVSAIVGVSAYVMLERPLTHAAQKLVRHRLVVASV